MLEKWAGDGRTLITATRSGFERNATRFAEHWAKALGRRLGRHQQERRDHGAGGVRLRVARASPTASRRPARSRPSIRRSKADSAARFDGRAARIGAAEPATPELAALDRASASALEERDRRPARCAANRWRPTRISPSCRRCSCSSRDVQGEDRRGAGGAATRIARVAAPVARCCSLLPSLGGAPSAFGAHDRVRARSRRPRSSHATGPPYRGARAEARSCYRSAARESADPRIKADAARATGDVRAANAFFQKAIKEYPRTRALRTRWGELFLATHQNNEAVEAVRRERSSSTRTTRRRCSVSRRSRPAGSRRRRASGRTQVIDETPDSSARSAICCSRAPTSRTARSTPATTTLDEALAIARGARSCRRSRSTRSRPSADLLRGTTDSEWTQRALALNAGLRRRVRDTGVFLRDHAPLSRGDRALAEGRRDRARTLYSAHAELGVNLLRENRSTRRSSILTIAYRGDPFSAPIVNTLRLHRQLRQFRRRRSTARPSAAASRRARTPAHESRRAPAAAQGRGRGARAVRARPREPHDRAPTRKRYGFELKEPVIVELYPEHDDFAVRTSGLPGIGLLGVTFGYLVAMDSPTGRADSDFHWGTTLWHEMAHVFTLEATNHLVPRWFSEGVSVYEEWSTGPLPGRHIPLPVLRRPSRRTSSCPSPSSIAASSGRRTRRRSSCRTCRPASICEYIAERFGQEALARDARRVTRRARRRPQAIAGRARHLGRGSSTRTSRRYVQSQLGAVGREPRAVAGGQQERSARDRRGQGLEERRRRPRRARSSSSPITSTRAARTSSKARAHRELGETALGDARRCSSTASAAATIPTR